MGELHQRVEEEVVRHREPRRVRKIENFFFWAGERDRLGWREAGNGTLGGDTMSYFKRDPHPISFHQARLLQKEAEIGHKTKQELQRNSRSSSLHRHSG